MSDHVGDGAAAISFKDCTPAICPYDKSFYQYRISIAANVAFLALFSLSLLGFLAVFAITRRGGLFSVAMVLGLICEILGYVGRIMSWKNQWSENGFLMQICCLTIGPAFFAAGIYLCIRKVVSAFGPENSRIPPKYYTRIFIPCDITSLILQAAGGALASSSFHRGSSTATGDNIMLAGLALQVLTLLVFLLLSGDFLASALRRDPALVRARASGASGACLAALALSAACVFWRSAFRVAELGAGWTGPLMGRQDLFVGFEGVVITVAVWALNVFHPSVCFAELMERDFEGGDGSAGERKGQGEEKEGRLEPEMLAAAKPSAATSILDRGGSGSSTSDVERGS